MSCRSAAYSSHSRSRSAEAVHAAGLIEDAPARAARPAARAPASSCSARPSSMHAAAPHVGIALDLARCGRCCDGCSRARAPRAAPDRRASVRRRRAAAGWCRAAPRRRPTRSARRGSRPGHRQPLLDAQARRAACAAGAAPWRATRQIAQLLGRRAVRPATATAPRLRIVPDVPMTRSKPALATCSQVARPSRWLMCLTSRRSSRPDERVALDEPLGEPDHAELEAPRRASCCVGVAERDLDAAAADVDDHGASTRRRRRRSPPPGGSAAPPRSRK